MDGNGMACKHRTLTRREKDGLRKTGLGKGVGMGYEGVKERAKRKKERKLWRRSYLKIIFEDGPAFFLMWGLLSWGRRRRKGNRRCTKNRVAVLGYMPACHVTEPVDIVSM